MGAVDIHPMAVDNSWQYRPQENPAKHHITGGADDAGGTFVTLIENIVLFFRGPLPDRGPFKAALNAFVAEERTLEDLGGLTRFYKPSKRLLRTPRSGRPGLWQQTGCRNS